jgi:hypothetical protein
MQGSSTEKTASLGINAVWSAFVAIDWGVAENTRHDIGTDLLLLARDEGMFELGLFVGAQVKTGPYYCRRPAREGDVIKGWWCLDSDDSELEAWARFPPPHLVVLHDLATSELRQRHRE